MENSRIKALRLELPTGAILIGTAGLLSAAVAVAIAWAGDSSLLWLAGPLAVAGPVLMVVASFSVLKSTLDNHWAAAMNAVTLTNEALALVPPLHRSSHQLFADENAHRPRSGRRVDAIFDAAELPQGLMRYATELRSEGVELRLLLLDPCSSLVVHHHLALEHDGGIEYVRSKIRKAVGELAPLCSVRLFDAMPPGNLLIIDDHILWGGMPSVPSDVPLPLVELTLDTQGHMYWAFRRNFDALWEHAQPVDGAVEPKLPSLVAAST